MSGGENFSNQADIELGESIILIDKHPSLISMPALGNTYTTICFGLKRRTDMITISESLLLEKEHVDFLGQPELEAACKTAASRNRADGRIFHKRKR